MLTYRDLILKLWPSKAAFSKAAGHSNQWVHDIFKRKYTLQHSTKKIIEYEAILQDVERRGRARRRDFKTVVLQNDWKK